jgi:hypothetical protein
MPVPSPRPLASLSPPGKNPPIQLSPANGIKRKRGRQSSTPAGEEANDSLREFMLIDARESVQENAEQAIKELARQNTQTQSETEPLNSGKIRVPDCLSGQRVENVLPVLQFHGFIVVIGMGRRQAVFKQ